MGYRYRSLATRTTYRVCNVCGQGFQAEYEYTDGDEPGMMLIEVRCKPCQEKLEKEADQQEDV